MRPPVIYLDSQDYSRFGDVLRGKGQAVHEVLFLELERRKLAGEVIFASSMPIFGELLQYDGNFRETTICKARAVERLCGSWALAFPTRMVAAELVTAARSRGLMPDGLTIEVLSSDRYWYPNVRDEFQHLREKIQAEIEPSVQALNLPSRQMRRGMKKMLSKMDFAAAAREAAPQMAEKYGLPIEVFERSIVALLRKTATPEQAGRMLFGAIAEPVKFVETYFEKVETDRSMPTWIKGFGRNYEEIFQTMQSSLQPYMHDESARETLERLISGWPPQLGPTVLKLARDDVAEFGLDPARVDALISDPEFVASVPAAQIVGQVLPAYARQVFGLLGVVSRVVV